MENTDEMRITWPGRVIIEKGQILVDGFLSENTTCRDLAIMAAAWAIGELQREMLKTIERPGGGNIGVGVATDYGWLKSGEVVEMTIWQDELPVLSHDASLKNVLLYAAGKLTGNERLDLITQLQASHEEMESRFR